MDLINDARIATSNLRGGRRPRMPFYRPAATAGRYRTNIKTLSKKRKTRFNLGSVGSEKRLKVPKSLVISQKYVDQTAVINTSLLDKANVGTSSAHIGGVPTSTNEGGRIGNNVRILGYKFTMDILPGTAKNLGALTAITTDESIRLFIVRYKHGSNNVDPGVSTWFNQDPTGNYTPTSFRNVEKLDDGEVLVDKIFRLGSTQSSIGTSHFNFNGNVSCSFIQRYTGTTAASIEQNPVWAYILNDTGHTSVFTTVNFNMRTIYTDV